MTLAIRKQAACRLVGHCRTGQRLLQTVEYSSKHFARLSWLCKAALVAVTTLLDLLVVRLGSLPQARIEGQEEAVQVAAVRHQLWVVYRPAQNARRCSDTVPWLS